MNKLNFLLAVIISLGMVCGCNLSYRPKDDNNSNRNRHQSNNRNSEDTPTNGKKSSDKQLSNPDSDNENESSSESDQENDSFTNRGDTSELAGKWVWARTGSGTYTTGGSYVGSNGSRFTYEFSEDGNVEFTGIMKVMQGNCQIQIFKSGHGAAGLNGDTLTINWSPADFTRDDSCDTAGNYKKTLPAETETLKVAFKNSGGQKQLCLTNNEEMCFSPTE